jgi:7,8-didemethyl-8-hydroxy-5-deazariboflavin synthase
MNEEEEIEEKEEKEPTGFGDNEDILSKINKENTITYSSAIDLVISSTCRNHCGYCIFKKNKQDLVVPYSTIKVFKKARKKGIREANFVAGERPDSSAYVRAKFDIWGFNSYSEYIYTLAELAFLEGLLVNLNIGYLTFNELKFLKEIIASVEYMLDTTSESMSKSIQHQYSPSKNPEIRIKLIENAGKLNIPTNTGMIIGIGETPEERIETIAKVKDLHDEYRNIQNFKISPFINNEKIPMKDTNSCSEDLLIETIRIAREILPSEIDISVPVNICNNYKQYIEAGVNDFGQIKIAGLDALFPKRRFQSIEFYEEELSNYGYQLAKRLPINNLFVSSQKYSKKLGQFLDKYKIKIKESQAEDEFVLTMQ